MRRTSSKSVAAGLSSMLLVVGLFTAVQTAAVADAPQLCGGKTATIVGTANGDQLTGTAGDDVIVGLGGGDIIDGMGGNDIICGGDGGDAIHGGDGNDTIYGGAANDVINGDAGDDVLYGDESNDSVSGDAGNDYVYGGDGRDSLAGGDGNDVLTGSFGNDYFDGGNDTDSCRIAPTNATTGCEAIESGVGERPGYTQLTSPLSDRVSVQVNPGTGNLELRSTDLSIRGSGLNYSVVRYWNSMAAANGAFGSNGVMSTGADVRLITGANGVITYYAPSGFTALYTPNGSGGFTAPSTYQAADLATSGSGWTLTFHGSSEKLTFNAAGKLTGDADRNGNANNFYYNSDGTLNHVSDTQGRNTSFSYAGGFISQLTDPSGRHDLYTYDAAGNLTQMTDATGAIWKFSYWEGNSNLDQIVDPRGNSETFSYDANHRVLKATYAAYTAAAATTSYVYNGATTTVTDPLGHATTYKSDLNSNVTSVTDPVGNQRQTAYDATGNVTSRTDPSQAITNFTYLSGGRLASAQMPSETTAGGGTTPGAMTTVAYGNSAQPYLPSQVSDPQGGQTRYGYDSAGNQTTASTYNADGSPTSTSNTSTNHYQGDADGVSTISCGARTGQLCSSVNARGNATTYNYDANGDVTMISPPAPLGHTTYSYDSLSRVTSSTDGKGVTTTQSYDADDRLTSTTTAGAVTSYGYDQSGNLTSRHDAIGTTTYSYDATGHLTNEVAPDSWGRSYSYDLAGNLISAGDSGGPAGTTSYGYDAANEPTTVTDPSGAATTLTWSNARRTATNYPDGVSQTVTYDNAGRPTRTTATHGSTTLVDQSGSYQLASGADRELLQQLTDNLAGTTTNYGYDGLNRLVEAATSGSSSSDYQYILDAQGNRTQTVTNGSYSAIDSFNAADQLVSRGGARFGGYDANGNATSDGTGQAYSYNASNQTTAITPPSASTITASYLDTDQSDRVGFGGTASVNGQLGDDQDTTAGNTTYFVRDPSGQLISERTTGGTFYYLYDLRGSVIGLADGAGTKVDSYAYDPSGNLTSPASAAPIANPWRYNAGYFDTATGLYHYGARYYDQKLGRFTQTDPTNQEPNTYLYASSDPVNRSDPTGTKSFTCKAIGVLGAGAGFGAIYLGQGGAFTFEIPFIAGTFFVSAGALAAFAGASALASSLFC
jgi:RHS repeat-associated protein